jgi:cytochrome c-type biogenesis protein CcmE
MKIAPPELSPGDTVEISVTHELVIHGEKSWVKYGVQSKVQTNETAEDARVRVEGLVTAGVMQTVLKTVETIEEMQT